MPSATTTTTATDGTKMSHPSSSSASSRSSMIGRSKRVHREVRFGSYVLGSTLGEGEFGKVKLGWRKDGKTPSQTAIKLIRRDSIPRGSERESKVHREINSLKRLAHPNIVRLEEVLQNDKYIGIVLEYASGGELFEYILEHRYLKDTMACKLFAQLVSGVDYMHSKGIVHRDLKLENLLLDKNKNIIISDFGFVNSFRDGNELMKTSCGSPCYAAPELVVSSEPYEARKVDVWSCGVILYAMLAGYLPFDDDPQNPDGDNIARLYHYITHTPLTFPEYVQPMPRDLLRKIIVSNPKKRITLKEARAHAWLSPHAPFLSVTPSEWERSYRSTRSRLHSNVEYENRRHSLMEGKITSASSAQGFLMNPQHARSYSTQNVSQKLYSHPAAPQTSSSHAIATIPVSASSHEISSPTRSIHSNNTGYIKAQFSPQSSTFEQSSTLNGHQRGTSMSNASIALHAVVNADVVERRSSVSNNDSNAVFVKPDLPHTSSVPHVKKSVEHSNNSKKSQSSLPDVAESSSSEVVMTNMLPPPMVPKSAGSATSNNSSTRLPVPHVKPRPTSYHPSSYSAGSNSDYYSLLPFNLTSTTSQVLKASPVSSSSHGSPQSSQREKRNSWSKISEPLVDMSSASGMLSTTENSEKRKSIALDSLSNAIESMGSSKDLNDDSSTLNEKMATLETGIQTSEASEVASVTVATATVNETASTKEEDAQVKDTKETSPLQQSNLIVEPQIQHTESITHSLKSEIPVQEPPTTQPLQALPTTRATTRNKHLSVIHDNKENKPTAARSKRFSFFYSSSTPSDQPTFNNSGNNNNTNKLNDLRQPTPSSSSSSSSTNRRVLEPSNETNIMKVRQDDMKKQNRMSSIGSSRGKESSAAKKVVDFFKRRSMRV